MGKSSSKPKVIYQESPQMKEDVARLRQEVRNLERKRQKMEQREREVERLQAELSQRAASDREMQSLRDKVRNLEIQRAQAGELERQAREKEREMREKEREMKSLKKTLGQANTNIANLQAAMKQKDAEHRKLISQLQSSLSSVQKEYKRLEAEQSDPARFKQNEQRLFDKFVNTISSMDFHNTGAKELRSKTGEVCVAFIGRVSAGKSTLINALFGERKQQTGRGRTTSEISEVGSIIGRNRAGLVRLKLRVFDVPGDDDSFSYTDLQTIDAMSKNDIFVVLFDNTPEYNSRVVRIARTMNKKVIFVRSKCDGAENDDIDLAQCTLTDKRIIEQSMGVPRPKVFNISAANVLSPRRLPLFDWYKFLHCLENTGHICLGQPVQAREAHVGPDDDAQFERQGNVTFSRLCGNPPSASAQKQESPRASTPNKNKNKAKSSSASSPKTARANAGTTSLFVGNLAPEVDRNLLSALFSEASRITIVTDRETRLSRGFAFVSFTSVEAAVSAKNRQNGTNLCGRNLRIDFKREAQKSPSD